MFVVDETTPAGDQHSPKPSRRVLLSLLRPSVRRGLREFNEVFEAKGREATADDFTPEGVASLDVRAKRIYEASLGLAGDDTWNDARAVAELLRLTGRHRDSLRAAEIRSRQGGDYQDFPIENRAQRLLKAALTGEAVAPTTPEDAWRFEIVGRFEELDDHEAWRQLCERAPALTDLANEVSSQPTPPRDYFRHPLDENHLRMLQEHIERDNALGRRLDTLLGPRSSADDVLLRSAYARSFAADYLHQLQTGR